MPGVVSTASATLPAATAGSVLFLDFDGVLQTPALGDWQEMELCQELLMLLDEMPELRVVVTSSHREGLGLSGVQGLLPSAVARRTIGITPLTPRCRARGGRQDEIEAWLAEHPSVSRFAAIDDEPHLYAQGCPWLVVTHPCIGWDAESSQRLRELFARTP